MTDTLIDYSCSGVFSNVFLIFEIASAAAIAIPVITFSYLYLKGINANLIKERVLIGVIWLIIRILPDLLMITAVITQIGLTSYAMYVAPLYIIISAVNMGLDMYMG